MKVEEDMKEFEVQRKAEMERVKTAATEEEKKRIMVRYLGLYQNVISTLYFFRRTVNLNTLINFNRS